MPRYDTIVIGAGLAGLATGSQLARAGQKVLVVTHGLGALLLASGCIDVLGYQPADSPEAVSNPGEKLAEFMEERPDHPYNLIGKEGIAVGLEAFGQMVNGQGLDYRGDLNHNWRLPSGIGAVHPTCLAPATLAGGDLSQGGRMLIVGFRELRDFYPGLISQNLNEQGLGVTAEPLTLELTIPLAAKMNATPLELGRAFEQAEFRRQVVQAVKSRSKGFDRVGFPAVLGVKEPQVVVADLEKQLGQPVFEISALPPSVPGRRLFEALKRALLAAGGRLVVGSKVADGQIEGGRVKQIRLEAASRLKPVEAENYVLATGGLFGGGLEAYQSGEVREAIFGLPVVANPNRHSWFEASFLSSRGQPVFNFGVKVNGELRTALAENLYVVGASLAGAEWTSGRVGDGLALGTAAAAVKQILG